MMKYLLDIGILYKLYKIILIKYIIFIMSGKERKIDRSRDKKRVKTQLKQSGKRYYSEDDNSLPEGAFSQDYNNNRLEENSEKIMSNNNNLNNIDSEELTKKSENDFVEEEFTDDYFEPKVMK
jgi:hypothetical protein